MVCSPGTPQVTQTDENSLQETGRPADSPAQGLNRRMKKYEIYLPLKYNNGQPIPPEKIKQVREELGSRVEL